jgi:hypothetical protein
MLESNGIKSAQQRPQNLTHLGGWVGGVLASEWFSCMIASGLAGLA